MMEENCRFRNLARIPKFALTAILVLFVLIFAIRLFYIVPLGSEAVLFNMGKYIGTAEQGLHLKAPWVKSIVVNTQEIRRFEFGEKTLEAGKKYEQNQNQQKMITADSKIVYISWVLQWRIEDPYSWYVNNNKGELGDILLALLAESEFRKEVANINYEKILTDGKGLLTINTKKRIQKAFDSLGVGIQVVDINISEVSLPKQVQTAYSEVQSAKEGKQIAVNTAEEYANKILEEAKGTSAMLMNKAEEYRIKKIAEAKEVSTRLKSLNAMYVNNPTLVKSNIYYEAIPKILSKLDLIFTDSDKNTFLIGDLGIAQK